MMRDDKILVLLKRSILDGKPLGANGSRSQVADTMRSSRKRIDHDADIRGN